MRKALFSACLISVIVLSFTFQAGQEAYASTVTSTRTITSTEWTTIVQSLTSTRYITSAMTQTSTSTRTKTDLTTTTQTAATTVDRRSTTTTYVPTTTTRTTPAKPGGLFELTVTLSDGLIENDYCLKTIDIIADDSSFRITSHYVSREEIIQIQPDSLEEEMKGISIYNSEEITLSVFKTRMHGSVWVGKRDVDVNKESRRADLLLDLSNVPDDRGTILIGERKDGTLYASGLDIVNPSNLEMTVTISDVNWLLNRVRDLLRQPREYYVTVLFKNDGKNLIVPGLVFFNSPQAMRIPEQELEVLRAPNIGGKLMASYKDIGKAATGGDRRIWLGDTITEFYATSLELGDVAAKTQLGYTIAGEIVGEMSSEEEPYLCGVAVKQDDAISTFAPLTPESPYLEFRFKVVERDYGSLGGQVLELYAFYLEAERLVQTKEAPFIEDFANLLIAEAGTTDYVVGKTHASAEFK